MAGHEEATGSSALPDPFAQLATALPPTSPARQLLDAARAAVRDAHPLLPALRTVVDRWAEAQSNGDPEPGADEPDDGR